MAPETFTCPECHSVLRYAPGLRTGDAVQCPKCHAQFTVPDAATLPAPPAHSGEEYTDAPASPRPRLSPPREDEYSTAPRPRDLYGPDDFADEDAADRPFSNEYTIEMNRWFELGSANYSAFLGPAIGYLLLMVLLYLAPTFLAGAVAGMVALQFGRSGSPQFVAVSAVLQEGLVFILIAALFAPLWAGLNAVCLAQIKGRRWSFGDFFSGFQRFGACAGVGLATQVATFLCLSLPRHLMNVVRATTHDPQAGLMVLALLVIGIPVLIFLQVRLFMFAFIIVMDRRVTAGQALKANWELTRGHFWALFGIALLLGLINLGGALLCGVGALFAMPYTALILNGGYLLISRGQSPPRQPLYND